MYVAFQSDAVRLALLQRYGGLWLDPAIICLKPFEFYLTPDWHGAAGIAAFYFSSWGKEMGKSKEYVENWLLAAQPEHPMIVRWKDIFNSYWNSLHGGWEQACLPKHPMFAHIDLSHMHRFGHDMRSYLVMHSCFQKMIHEEPEMRRIWQEEMLLFKAEEGALWHLEEVDWTVDKAMQKWLGPRNQAWEKYVVTHCPVLKFTRAFAECLDRQPRWKFVNRDDLGSLKAGCCLGMAFLHALSFECVD